ncbi:hypothetical protein TRFO_17901 [Tritrichomonas foetus]|uniref:Uncharacterized protein n=1 Tax=Tritrichomonas foetus TaxID=1144522 RepID=A0A1J4KRM3_9EUKA|nr:hypothetical protein TRFO_17901 [Tritrichomonas foetus]|eukprot:OHT12318.1 hypothetical protein TRFO_17901 [Tritrichomonas foetus]
MDPSAIERIAQAISPQADISQPVVQECRQMYQQLASTSQSIPMLLQVFDQVPSIPGKMVILRIVNARLVKYWNTIPQQEIQDIYLPFFFYQMPPEKIQSYQSPEISLNVAQIQAIIASHYFPERIPNLWDIVSSFEITHFLYFVGAFYIYTSMPSLQNLQQMQSIRAFMIENNVDQMIFGKICEGLNNQKAHPVLKALTGYTHWGSNEWYGNQQVLPMVLNYMNDPQFIPLVTCIFRRLGQDCLNVLNIFNPANIFQNMMNQQNPNLLSPMATLIATLFGNAYTNPDVMGLFDHLNFLLMNSQPPKLDFICTTYYYLIFQYQGNLPNLIKPIFEKTKALFSGRTDIIHDDNTTCKPLANLFTLIASMNMNYLAQFLTDIANQQNFMEDDSLVSAVYMIIAFSTIDNQLRKMLVANFFEKCPEFSINSPDQCFKFYFYFCAVAALQLNHESQDDVIFFANIFNKILSNFGVLFNFPLLITAIKKITTNQKHIIPPQDPYQGIIMNLLKAPQQDAPIIAANLIDGTNIGLIPVIIQEITAQMNANPNEQITPVTKALNLFSNIKIELPPECAGPIFQFLNNAISVISQSSSDEALFYYHKTQAIIAAHYVNEAYQFLSQVYSNRMFFSKQSFSGFYFLVAKVITLHSAKNDDISWTYEMIPNLINSFAEILTQGANTESSLELEQFEELGENFYLMMSSYINANRTNNPEIYVKPLIQSFVSALLSGYKRPECFQKIVDVLFLFTINNYPVQLLIPDIFIPLMGFVFDPNYDPASSRYRSLMASVIRLHSVFLHKQAGDILKEKMNEFCSLVGAYQSAQQLDNYLTMLSNVDSNFSQVSIPPFTVFYHQITLERNRNTWNPVPPQQ